jgi:hypothetical protein
MKHIILSLLCLVTMLFSATVCAESFPVDDSESQVLSSGPVKMRWEHTAPGPGQSSAIIGQVSVLVRLNVAAWKGRTARIYHKLDNVASGPVNVQWASNGPLQPGQLVSGQRTLIYSGAITADRIQDTLRLTIQTDGNRVVRPQDLNFSFEIELE